MEQQFIHITTYKSKLRSSSQLVAKVQPLQSFTMRLFSILTLLGSASAVVFEAENATLTGNLYVATAVPGFSGAGYVAGFQTTNDTILFTLTGLVAGSYDIAVIYSAQYGNKYTSVSVNGAASVEIAIDNITTSNCRFGKIDCVIHLYSFVVSPAAAATC
jgi:hypothetical protein